MTDRQILTALAELLGADVLTEEDAASELADRGMDLGADPVDRLRGAIQFEGAFTEITEGLVWLPGFLDGTRWSVFIDADDAAEGFVKTTTALEPLIWWMISSDVQILDATGAVIGTHETDDLADSMTDIVSGPKGWLDQLAGQWAQVTVNNGSLQWAPLAEPPDTTDRQKNAIRAGFESAARNEQINEYTQVITDEDAKVLVFTIGSLVLHDAIHADREAFVVDPIPPLAEIFTASGLEERGSTIAAVGFDWDALERWRYRNRSKWQFGLNDQEAEFLETLVGASQLVVEGGPNALGTDEEERATRAAVLAAILEQDETVAEALWSHATQTERPESELLAFADSLIATLGVTSAGVAWLRSRCLDSMGQTFDAIKALDPVLADTTHRLALIDAAAFASDRGDAQGALRLLQRAGTVEYLDERDESDTQPALGLELLREVYGYATNRPKPMARRNDRCPCGSGKKYKACHLGTERHALNDRSSWLYDKARRHAFRAHNWLIEELADQMSIHAEDPEVADHFADSEFTADLALHEGEVFNDFLEARGMLLPDDEVLLATQWTLVDRGVFEVEEAGEDFIELYDIARGERITVTNTHYSDRSQPGVVLLGRPLPVGDTWRAFGGFLEIPRSMVQAMLTAIESGNSFDIAELYSTSLAPPRMANTDGELLEFHQLEWLLGDDPEASIEPSAIDSALASIGFAREGGGGDPAWNLVRDTKNQPRSVIATLLLEEGVLTGGVNSQERADELINLISAALPNAVLDDDNVRTMEQAIEFHKAMREIDPNHGAGDIDQTDPAIQAILAEAIIEHETRWLDEPVPALRGLSPREAAADPVAREELEQLIKSFPRPTPDFTGMDPDRIRHALGLD